MTYKIAERFKSVQGEGVYAGTPMAFIRFVGCSVGKSICSACDTDFEEAVPWRGGGKFTLEQLHGWAEPYEHICLTGGEPLDQPELRHLISFFMQNSTEMIHVETSGTTPEIPPGWNHYDHVPEYFDRDRLWICVSPKPGFHEEWIDVADEVKVIMPGLGVLKHGVPLPKSRDFMQDGRAMTSEFPWPTLDDALRWAASGKTVFLQPRNGRNDLDLVNLRLCQDIVAEHPELRLSVQLHKILRVQ
jgi:organic radical activating enzyme